MSNEREDHVLVVDDDASIREVLAEILEQEGIPVRTCASGIEALAAIQAGLRPRLILLDLRMPELDGVEFCRRLDRLAEVPPIPVIVLSGDQDACREANELAVASCLTKPVDLDVLLRAVERHRAPSDTPMRAAHSQPARP